MKKSKPCVFCGSTGNKSKEHFYPDWLSSIVSSDAAHNISTTLTKSTNELPKLKEQSRQQGHLITKKIRVVCCQCNNGWMSQIESKVKPILTAGIDRRDLIIKNHDIETLARWVFIKTIIAEHSNAKLASTPYVDRHAFFSNFSIPDYFRIYIGIQSTPSITWLYRHSVTISFSSTVDPPLLDGLEKNTQTLTFILGRLVFHVLAARVRSFDMDNDISYPGLAKIWPAPPQGIQLSELRPLDSNQLRTLRESLEGYLIYQRPQFYSEIA